MDIRHNLPGVVAAPKHELCRGWGLKRDIAHTDGIIVSGLTTAMGSTLRPYTKDKENRLWSLMSELG